MMKKALATLVLFLMVCPMTSAQQSDVATIRDATSQYPLGMPASSPFSLLDASRMKWSHSYSMTFFSGGNSSGSLGMLSSTMTYELSSKLSFAFNLGVMHNTGALFRAEGSDATLLPGFTIDFHPSKNFQMSLSVQKYNGLMTPYFYPRSRSLGGLGYGY